MTARMQAAFAALLAGQAAFGAALTLPVAEVKGVADDQAKTFNFGTWYTFTFRLTIKNYGKTGAEFKVDILVDGAAFGSSTCFYSDENTSSATSGTLNFTEGQQVNIRFQPQMRIHAEIYVDDLTMTVSRN